LDNIIRNCFHFYDVNKASPFIKMNIGIENEQAHLEFVGNEIWHWTATP